MSDFADTLPEPRGGLTLEDYVTGVTTGDRTRLARAITLIESNAPVHQALAEKLLTALLPLRCPSVRLGITGVPGVGKSTFIEHLGCQLTAAGHRVAVLAVDPSSTVTGGSILGDKTRMAKLATETNAFVRPSPTGGTLGGVARKTRESIAVFEAAGYDVILVETVGVGQSEVQVRSLVDVFLLLVLAGAGDELQGIKKGVVELADVIAVNKADGAGQQAAATVRHEFERALAYVRPATPGWRTTVHTCSGLTGDGVFELWRVVEEAIAHQQQSGGFDRRRAEQDRMWVQSLIEEGLASCFAAHPAVAKSRDELEALVVQGRLPAMVAAKRLLALFAAEVGCDPGLDDRQSND